MTIVIERVLVSEIHRTPLVLVSGWSGPTDTVARSLLRDDTVVVHHDLDLVHEGVVRRTVTTMGSGRERTRVGILELAHGCISCTLREDLLPLLRRLHARSSVQRIVLHLDRRLEPEAVCWAIEHVVVSGVVGQLDGTASRDVRVEAVITCIDAQTWLDDATGDEALDDDRTVAQVAVGQVDFADALVVSGSAGDGWQQARLHAVLARLAPGAPIAWDVDGLDVERLLLEIPSGARRGELTNAHSPLLRGQPPLSHDCGVMIVEFSANRPFHPERLHEAIDVLLEGVVTARGRVWVATQPDEALWLESAGGGLRVASADRWLAAMTPAEQDQVPTARRAMAALCWDERFGDRHSSMVVLVHAADPSDIDRTLQWALVTDEELADEAAWESWPDPFGQFHEDPCDSSESPYAEPDSSREGHE
ncbi:MULTISPECIES: ribosome hibernation factor-recruiting GTPase MRF [Rhodococcus]|uniref:GTP-binding protein n=1 Tax=Rhodococcus oxybenzonivorans TaxID=1990687 RepID=A0AAE4UX19_9NOCA|nr:MULTISPECIES: GTP-binding protein [Rhodococcus]MDV7243918.1 GTP-binding protein [Rhodococcus oxybenzonivorans]MDV7263823.1 GTP-binding protein [Rhodococcus oxybenzonivorans]MDV7274840.1 GTP-binding protein [Rhodococcus oxybenzonivorans]MDV7335079.1 GTP-binding protein [Rhodococcus oxybenzonivorans]MDV7345790.1 GTP-binding protein [Rhodococcus oxybenzonivorans]